MHNTRGQKRNNNGKNCGRVNPIDDDRIASSCWTVGVEAEEKSHSRSRGYRNPNQYEGFTSWGVNRPPAAPGRCRHTERRFSTRPFSTERSNEYFHAEYNRDERCVAGRDPQRMINFGSGEFNGDFNMHQGGYQQRYAWSAFNYSQRGAGGHRQRPSLGGSHNFGRGIDDHHWHNKIFAASAAGTDVKEIVNDDRGKRKKSSSTICQKQDYDASSGWCEVCLTSHSHRYCNRFFVLLLGPVISYFRPQRSVIPHYHITEPFYKNPDQIGRHMVQLELPDDEICQIENSFDFTVLSYNVLADQLLNDNRRLYEGYADWILGWDYRKNNLLKEIVTYNADVICLQEVQQNHMSEFFIPKLKENGYIGFYKKRTGGKQDGCAIFYRGSRFKYLGCRMLEFRKQGHSLMNRDNVAVVLSLQPTGMPSKPPIVIANTHLLFNKNRGDIKLLQLATLLAEIDEMAKVFSHFSTKATSEDAYNPVIICGDFNSVPFSPVYDFVVNGHLKYTGQSRIHLSGQNSPMKKPTHGSILNSQLITEDIGITDLCQKMNRAVGSMKDTTLLQMSGNHGEDESECLVIGEKIDGKKVVLEEPGVLKHLLNLQSVYTHFLKDGEKEVSTCHTEGCLCVDYIFFSQGMHRTLSAGVDQDDDIFIKLPRRQLYLMQMLSLLGSNEVEAMGKLPNICLSSDHIALLAGFKLLD
eukprot:gene19937-21890_t